MRQTGKQQAGLLREAGRPVAVEKRELSNNPVNKILEQ